MAANVYEGMFILDANRYTRDAAGVVKKIEQMIQGAGGELLVSRLWEERRLAYHIKGQRRGAYWLTYFRLDGENLTGLDRQCEINEQILRQLFLKVNPRIVDALIAHASADKKEPAAVAGAAGEKPAVTGAKPAAGGEKPAAGAADQPAGGAEPVATGSAAEAETAVAVPDQVPETS